MALPSQTIDWEIDGREVTHIDRGEADRDAPAVLGPAFEPGRGHVEGIVCRGAVVTALITERGICAALRAGLLDLFPERGQRLSNSSLP